MLFPKLKTFTKIRAEQSSLDDCILVGIQHLLASNGSLFEQLNGLGMPYDSMFLLGKVYSTNTEVMNELQGRGCKVMSKSSFYNHGIGLKTDYNESLHREATAMLDNAIAYAKNKKIKRLLILDDGGILIQSVSERKHLLEEFSVHAVEQTRAGSRLVSKIMPAFPVVNVAESRVKLEKESPMVALSIMQEIVKGLHATDKRLRLSDMDCLVVGNGSIGNEVHKLLKKDARTSRTYDTNKRLSSENDLKKAVVSSQLIVGCVGEPWVNSAISEAVQAGTILVSGSSSNTEFLGLTQIEKHASKAHDTILVENSNGTSSVLNAGFPINFDGSQDPIDAEEIEITRLAMYSAVIQCLAEHSSNHGLIPLSKEYQRLIDGLF